MKKVGCLYRVSTKKQGDGNDIPVQRNACLKYIEKRTDWIFEKEYIELGVSGYKKNAAQRDILQKIKKDVLDEKIDILLVFMFDRIGRIEDETPFVVGWLIKHGIEVWSANEGQMTINNRNDKLINYITYWQASGESEKISLRATERRIQLIKEGIYMGNYPPYGYELVESDIVTKIGKKRKVLQIEPEEAKIVKKVFDLFLDMNYGVDKITVYLNSHNIKRRKKEAKWRNDAILEMLRNPIYKGFVSFGKRTRRKDIYTRNERKRWILSDEPNEEIVIIPEDRWEKTNRILDSRSRKGKRKIRLLSGLTKCGYCKDHITPKGREKYTYMVCNGKKTTGICLYNANYRLDIIESIVIEEIQQYLDTLEKIDLKEIMLKKNIEINSRKEQLQKINKKMKFKEETLNRLKKEVISSLISGNEEEKEQLGKKIQEENIGAEDLKNKKNQIEKEIEDILLEINELEEYIPNWKDEFLGANVEKKREILKMLIENINLYNDKIEICTKYPIEKMIMRGEVGNL